MHFFLNFLNIPFDFHIHRKYEMTSEDMSRDEVSQRTVMWCDSIWYYLVLFDIWYHRLGRGAHVIMYHQLTFNSIVSSFNYFIFWLFCSIVSLFQGALISHWQWLEQAPVQNSTIPLPSTCLYHDAATVVIPAIVDLDFVNNNLLILLLHSSLIYFAPLKTPQISTLCFL